MIILITGGTGQLGTELTIFFSKRKQYVVHSLSSTELDVTDQEEVNKVFKQIKPDVVFHAAAYTKVDLAEEFVDKAYQINSIGTRNVAKATEAVQGKIVYFSTDYIFDGNHDKPYHEMDLPAPINSYGYSKLIGEYFVKWFSNQYFIVRTSWLFGIHGDNFVKSIIEMTQNNSTISIVDDQFGCPTYSLDLVVWTEELILSELFGTYHVSNSGSCSWYEFAQAIMEDMELNVQVIPIKTAALNRTAKRPKYSVLDHKALNENNLENLRDWRLALKEFLKA